MDIDNVEEYLQITQRRLRKYKMRNRNFDKWLGKFKASISSYAYYVDFEKVYRNVDAIKIELHILNLLLAVKILKKTLSIL